MTLSPIMGAPVAVKLEWSVPRHSVSSLFSAWQNKGTEGTLIDCYGNTQLTQSPNLYWCVWEDVLQLHQESTAQEADLYLQPPLMSGQTLPGDKAALGQSSFPSSIRSCSKTHRQGVAISNEVMLCTCKVDPIFLQLGRSISSFS